MSQTVSLQDKSFTQRLMNSVAEKPVSYFLIFWFVLNLLQIALMELTSDEGYYWFYAQQLQWGYYDHPPMIALLIKMGSAILPGELGVRFFNVLLSTAGLTLFFTLIPDELERKSKTYLVLLSAPLLHYLTFLLFPDGPLLFFSLLFLVLYKRFLKQETLRTAILLGLSLALMAYSKYHGVLVLLFTVIANPKLLKSGYFYLVLFVAAVLFAPHLWWQYSQDFPTLKYHLSGRTGELSFRHVGEYLSQQVVAIGPGLIFIPFVCRATDVFERTLKTIIIGTLLFFLLSSVKTFVHFHWTSIALYPLLYFAVAYYNQPEKRKLFQWLVLPYVLLFFIARILLAVPIIPTMHVGEDYYHGRKAWAKEISVMAGDKPVFMPNNLREASLYSYYASKTGITLYTRPGKKSQYELWGYEDSLQGKEVLVVTDYPVEGSREKVNSLGQKVYHTVVPSFQSYYDGITINVDLKNPSPSDTTLIALLEIVNTRKQPASFGKEGDNQLPLIVYSITKKKKMVQDGLLPLFTKVELLSPGDNLKKEVRVPIQNLPSGDYRLHFGIRVSKQPDAILSEGAAFTIN